MTPEAGRDIGKRSINFLRYVVSILYIKLMRRARKRERFTKLQAV